MADAALTIWTVYKHPRDYPTSWVLRAHDVPGGPRVECMVCNSLEEARACVPFGLVRIPRDRNDEAQVYESWL